MTPLLRVDIACNNPDNGLFDNAAHMIQVDGDTLQLEARGFYFHRSPRMTLLPDTRFRLAGKVWTYEHVRYGLGNWCWNAYWFKLPDAVRFFAWLKGRDIFTVNVADERLFSSWKTPGVIDQTLWSNVLERIAAGVPG